MKHWKLVPALLVLCLAVQAQPKTGVATESFFSLTYFNFWTLLLYLLVIGVAAWCWFGLKASAERHREEIEALKTRFSTFSSASAKRPTLEEVKKQVEMLVDNHAKWGDAQEDMNALIQRLENLEKDRQPTAAAGTAENPVRKEKKAVPETFFMSFPVGNYFPITAKSDTRENTIYRFRVRANKTEADFDVHTAGASVQEVIGMVQTYIKPACDEENMPSQQVKNIVTSQSGLAVLEGDKWIIKKKALIRYE